MRGGDRGRLAAGPGWRWRCGSRRSPRCPGENGAPGAPLRHRGGRRPADRPGRRGRAHAGVRPVPPRRRDGRADRAPAAGRGGPRAGATGWRPTAAATCPRTGGALEQALRSGELLGLAATNALELGHRHLRPRRRADRRLPRHPGRAVAAGRPGRPRRRATRSGCWSPATTRWTPTWSPTPRRCSGAPVEANVFDPDNPYVLGPHLCAAAAELPLTEEDLPLFGPRAREGVDALTAAGLLRRRPRGWFWTDRRRASDLADIRSSGGPPVRLVEAATGRVLGTVDQASAHPPCTPVRSTCTRARRYLVDAARPRRARGAMVHARGPRLHHVAREITDIEILGERPARADWGTGPGQPGRGPRHPPGRVASCAAGAVAAR